MNFYSKWLFYFFSTVIIIYGFTAALNFAVDPFGSNEYFVERQYKPIFGEEKQKYNYVFARGNYRNFDTLIVGSSRTMCIRPDSIPELGNAYNFGISSATLSEQLFIVKEWLKQPDSQLKTLIIGIDFLAFDEKANQIPSRQVADKFTSGNQNYLSYILSFDTIGYSLRCVQNQWNKQSIIYFREDGAIVYAQREQQIEMDRFDFSDDRMTLDAQERYLPHMRMVYDRRALEYLKEIKELCDKKGVKVFPFITPEHRNLFSMIMQNPTTRTEYFQMRVDVLSVFESYLDLGGMNGINRDNRNFYDNLHYRPAIGTQIASRLYHPASGGYGAVVTKKNIDAHLRQIASFNEFAGVLR